jgi:transposase-like protein
MLSELLARREGCVGCLVGGESLNGLSKRHGICRHLIRVWVAKHETGAIGAEGQAADLHVRGFGPSASHKVWPMVWPGSEQSKAEGT